MELFEEVLGKKRASSRELREKAFAIANKMAALAAKPSMTTAEERQFNDLNIKVAKLQQEITETEVAERAGTEMRAVPLRAEAGFPGDEAQGARGDIWVDARTGREVQVLAPKDSLAARTRSAGGYEEQRLGFGEYCRAMVLGPKTDSEKRALTEGTDSAGGFLVPTILSAELIDKLRARAVCVRAGARTLPMPSPFFGIARVATDPVAGWRNEGAPIAESGSTFERVDFKAQALGCLVKVSRELLEDASNLNSEIPLVFAKVMALELDRVCLIGTGTPPEPKGISNIAGVGSVSLGTAPADYNSIIDAVQQLRAANAADPTAAIMNPRTLTEFDKLQDTLHQPLRRPQSVVDLPFLSTTQVPITEDYGSPIQHTASRMFVGDFAQMFIAVRTELRVEVLKERFMADAGMYGFIAWLRADMQVTHPQSFAQVVGVF